MKGLCLSTGGERGVEWLAAVALAAAAAWLAPAPLSAQDPSTPVTPEMKQVTVDLGSGTINAVLPFDEPFLLVGTPPPQTIRIEATYCEIAERSARELGSLLANAPASSGSLSLCVGGPAKANRLLPWTGQTTSFQLLVPDRLPVNRNFLFQFTIARALSDSELAALKTQVRSELDRELRTIDATQPASLGAAQYDQLLATIRRVLAAQPLAAGQVPQPEAGSVFDPAAASADAGDFSHEGDGPDGGVLRQRLPRDFAESVYGVPYAVGNPGGLAGLRENRGGERAELRGFVHHGAARGERGRDLPGGEHERRVPGSDDPHRADGCAKRVIEMFVLEERKPVSRLGRLVGEESKVLRSPQCRRFHESNGLAGIHALDERDFFRPLEDELRQAIQDPLAVFSGCPAPPGKRGGRRRRGRVHILRNALGDLAERGVVDRRQILERAPRGARSGGTFDEMDRHLVPEPSKKPLRLLEIRAEPG